VRLYKCHNVLGLPFSSRIYKFEFQTLAIYSNGNRYGLLPTYLLPPSEEIHSLLFPLLLYPTTYFALSSVLGCAVLLCLTVEAVIKRTECPVVAWKRQKKSGIDAELTFKARERSVR
jgi:hypothetical protein